MAARTAISPYFVGNVPHDMKVLRVAFDLTQRQMAERLGITAQYLNDIEHGRRRLSDDRILACKITAIRKHLISSRICEYEAIISSLKRSED